MNDTTTEDNMNAVLNNSSANGKRRSYILPPPKPDMEKALKNDQSIVNNTTATANEAVTTDCKNTTRSWDDVLKGSGLIYPLVFIVVAAFAKVVVALLDDICIPGFSLMTGYRLDDQMSVIIRPSYPSLEAMVIAGLLPANHSYTSLEEAEADGVDILVRPRNPTVVSINWGHFIHVFLEFVILLLMGGFLFRLLANYKNCP